MEELHGQLIGGPDDGNFVTTSQREIPVVSTTELWLDGESTNADVSIIVVKGVYVWLEDTKYFTWKQKDSAVFTKKMEAA